MRARVSTCTWDPVNGFRAHLSLISLGPSLTRRGVQFKNTIRSITCRRRVGGGGCGLITPGGFRRRPWPRGATERRQKRGGGAAALPLKRSASWGEALRHWKPRFSSVSLPQLFRCSVEHILVMLMTAEPRGEPELFRAHARVSAGSDGAHQNTGTNRENVGRTRQTEALMTLTLKLRAARPLLAASC